MIQKIKAEDVNEREKNYIKDYILSGSWNISYLDYLVNDHLADASAKYKEQAKAEIRAAYEQWLQGN